MKERIKIAYLLTPVDFGGSEKVSVNFLKNIDKDQFDICPITLIRPWEDKNIFIKKLENDGYTFCKIPVAIRNRHKRRDYLRIIRCFKILHSILQEGSFDLIHTHGYFADLIGIVAAKKLHIPIVSTSHGFISNDRKLTIYNKLDRIALRYFDKIIAVSGTLKKELMRSGVKESKIIVIQNAVEFPYNQVDFGVNRRKTRLHFDIKDEDCVIGYVGRLSEEKGVRYLVEAGSIMKGKVKNFRIVMIGDGLQRKELECLVKQYKLENEIIFMGFQSDIENWIPALDIFVLPSLTEGTPMAILEAMSLGLPVVATRVGGVPEIVDNGINGFLINPANSTTLAEKLSELLHNPRLRKIMGEAALKMIKKKHNIRDWCSEIEMQYNLLACKNRKRIETGKIG